MRDHCTVLRRIFDEFIALMRRYGQHRDDFTAAALAFYVALALAPAALALGALASLVLSPDAVRSVLEGLEGQVPDSVGALAPLIASLVGIVERSSAASFTLATIIGVLVAVYAVSRFVYVLRIGLDVVHGTASEHQGLVARLRSAVLTFIVVIVSAAALVALNLLPRIFGTSGTEVVNTVQGWAIIDWVISLAIIYFVIRLLYIYGPHQRNAVPWLSFGAAFSTAWVVGATVAVGYMLVYSQTLGAAIALLGFGIGFVFWLYVLFIGVLMGAEIEQMMKEGLLQRLRG